MYIDIIIMENIIINYFMLRITSKYSKYKTNKLRLSIGAFIGAIYVIVVFIPSLRMMSTFLIKIAISIIMIIIAFSPEKLRDFVKIISIFYIVSFTFGGAAFSLFYFTNTGTNINGIYYIKDFPLSLLITAFIIVYFLLLFCVGFIQSKFVQSKLIYKLKIYYKKQFIEINAILDTGNSLKDPLTNYPVIVAEYKVLKDILPESIYEIFSNNIEPDIYQVFNSINEVDFTSRLRLIPYTSLGRKNGMLIGFKPDYIDLNIKKVSKKLTDVIIAIYYNEISQNGEYSALLFPEIIS